MSPILFVCRNLFLQTFILLMRNHNNLNLHLVNNFILKNAVNVTSDNFKLFINLKVYWDFSNQILYPKGFSLLFLIKILNLIYVKPIS